MQAEQGDFSESETWDLGPDETEDFNFDRENRDTPMLAVYHMCQEMARSHPSNPWEFVMDSYSNQKIVTVEYQREINAKICWVSFNRPRNEEHAKDKIRVVVSPPSFFHQNVQPEHLLADAVRDTRGFLDPVTGTIPYTNVTLKHTSNFETYSIKFTLTGAENIEAGARLLLNRLVFSD